MKLELKRKMEKKKFNEITKKIAQKNKVLMSL